MSFLNKITRIFSEPKESTLTLDEAIKTISRDKSEKTDSIITESYTSITEISSEIQGLRDVLAEFEKIKLEDKRAKASGDVKDRFCKTSDDQLSAIKKPVKEPSEMRIFLIETHKALTTLGGLTSRQMIHLGFFFKTELANISKKTTRINELVKKTKKELDKIDNYERFFHTLEQSKALEEQLVHLEDEKKTMEGISENLKIRLGNIDAENIDTRSLTEARTIVVSAEATKNSIEQEITSYLSVDKMLKRLRHDKNIRDETLDAYIKSASTAIIPDGELKIFKFLGQVVPEDARTEEKLKRILGNQKYIQEKREEFISVLHVLEERKSNLRSIEREIEEKRTEIMQRRSQVEQQLVNQSRELEKINSSIVENRERKKNAESEIVTIAERLTDSKITYSSVSSSDRGRR